jgi:hypothetical protein
MFLQILAVVGGIALFGMLGALAGPIGGLIGMILGGFLGYSAINKPNTTIKTAEKSTMAKEKEVVMTQNKSLAYSGNAAIQLMAYYIVSAEHQAEAMMEFAIKFIDDEAIYTDKSAAFASLSDEITELRKEKQAAPIDFKLTSAMYLSQINKISQMDKLVQLTRMHEGIHQHIGKLDNYLGMPVKYAQQKVEARKEALYQEMVQSERQQPVWFNATTSANAQQTATPKRGADNNSGLAKTALVTGAAALAGALAGNAIAKDSADNETIETAHNDATTSHESHSDTVDTPESEEQNTPELITVVLKKGSWKILLSLCNSEH